MRPGFEKRGDVLDHDDGRSENGRPTCYLKTQLVSWIASVLLAESREALARRSSDENVAVTMRNDVPDVRDEQVSASEVRCVRCGGVSVHLDGACEAEALLLEGQREQSSASEQVDDRWSRREAGHEGEVPCGGERRVLSGRSWWAVKRVPFPQVVLVQFQVCFFGDLAPRSRPLFRRRLGRLSSRPHSAPEGLRYLGPRSRSNSLPCGREARSPPPVTPR